MLVSKNAKICITPNANAIFAFPLNAKPQLKLVEYRLHWVSWHSLGNYISCCLCQFRLCCVANVKHSFQWNMGLTVILVG